MPHSMPQKQSGRRRSLRFAVVCPCNFPPSLENATLFLRGSTPEAGRACQVLALARKMMDGRTKQDILDSSYHRYAFHDTGVPKWFYEDEKRHMRRAPCPAFTSFSPT